MGLDPEDTDLAELHWYPNAYGYLIRQTGKAGTPKHRTIYLHRVVAERMFGPIPADRLVDHINRDRQDNRRSNLRLVDRTVHSINRTVSNKSGLRWVTKHSETSYSAEVKWRGERFRKHGFVTAQGAADARRRCVPMKGAEIGIG